MSNDAGRPAYDRCGAKGRGTGKPYGLPAGWGTDHPGVGRCRKHWGTTPNHVTAAARIMAQRACEQLGVQVETTPDEALHEALLRAQGRVLYFAAREAALGADELTFGATRRVIRPDVSGGMGVRELHQEARVSAWTRLLQDAEDRLAKIAAVMKQLGIEERRVAITEQQVAQIRRVLDGVLTDLNLSAEQRAKLPEVVPARIRQLTAVPDA